MKTLASEGGGGLSRRALSCCCSSLSGTEIKIYLFHFIIYFILFSCLFSYLSLVAAAPTCLGQQWKIIFHAHNSVQRYPLHFNPIKIAIIIIIIDNEDRCPPITENWDQADRSSGMATRSSKPPQTN